MLNFVKLPLLLLCIFCAMAANAADALTFKVLSSAKKEVEVGANINVIVSISNQTETDRDFRVRLNCKNDEFKLISDYSSLRIDKNSSTNKIISIHISTDLPAGDYNIDFEAIDNKTNLSFGKSTSPVYVKPRYEIEVVKLNDPQLLFGGDTATVYYVIKNLSNLEVPVKTTVIDGTLSKESVIKIPKDSSVTSNYRIKVPTEINSYTRQSIILIAAVPDKKETSKSSSFSFDVFPVRQAKFDRFNRFPVSVSLVSVTSNRLAKNMVSTMYDVHATNSFGKDKDQQLEFHFRGPDRSGNPLLGLNDDYHLKYESPHLNLALGDNSFTLSELTEASRNGRGVELTFKVNKWSIGGYYNKPRYYPLITQMYAAYTDFTFNPTNSISLGFLSKTDTTSYQTKLLSLSGSNAIKSWLHWDYELALNPKEGEYKKAYKAAISLRFSSLSYSLQYSFADPKFSGYISNSQRFSTAFSFKFKIINFSLNYSTNNSNMALDTLYSNAPQSKNYGVMSYIKLTPKNTLSLGVYSLSLTDKSPSRLFDYTQNNGRLSLNNHLGKLDLTMQVDAGKMRNKLAKDSLKYSLSYNGSITMGYQFGKKLSASLFTNYEGGKERVTGVEQLYYGGSLNSVFNSNFSISFQYNSNYEWKYFNTDRSLVSLTMNARLNETNELSLGANYNLVKNTLDKKEYNIQLRYSHVLNIPVSKKKDVGSLTGKILNHGIEKVGGIRINVNGIVTITDKEGNFKISSLPIGTYTIGLDAANFGLNAIPEKPGPYVVTIEPSKVSHFELGMTKSSKITGTLVIQEDEHANQKGYVAIKEQISKLIIEATNGTEVYRVMTENGIFVFNDLRPGNWQVKVYSNGLPQGYQLVTSQFNLDVSSGSLAKVEVLIKKQARQIKFQTMTTK